MKYFNNLKIYLLCFVFVPLLVITTACGSDADTSSEKETIRVTHVVAEDHPYHQAAKEFKEEVEEESDGKLEVEIYPDWQLYESEREAIEAIQLGDVEMSRVATPALSSFISEFSVLNLPFLFEDTKEAHAALDGELGDKLTELLSEEGLVAFGYGENGFRHFLTDKPIESPDDFSGMSIRVIENKMYEDLFNSLGANASPLGFGETYTALQQGVYDGMDSEIASASTGSFYEVLDYLTISNHAYTATVNIIDEDFYDSLSEDLQGVLEDATYTLNERHRELNMEHEEEGLEELKENMEVNELTQEQTDKFKEELQPIFEKYEEEIGEDIVKLANQ